MAVSLAIKRIIIAPKKFAEAPINPPYAAPIGFQWAFVVDNGKRAIENGNRAITLVKAA